MPPQPLTVHDDGLVTETLDTIAAERGSERGNFNRSFELVDEIIRKLGEDGLAERLYGAIPVERPWADIADLFGILIWSTSDNGGALIRTMEQWLLDATDVRQCQIALHLDVYPFSSPSSEDGMMERVLADVAAKFPETSDQCRELVESYQRKPKAGA
jgi:hypothetical protein